MISDTIPHYWIIKKIGIGAMGIIYKSNEFLPNPKIVAEITKMVQGK